MAQTTSVKRTVTEFIKPTELMEIHEMTPLTLNDRRVFNCLIANAWESIGEDKEHVISKTALKGAHKGNARIEDTILRLMTTCIEVDCKVDGEAGWKRTQLLGENKSTKNNQGLLYYNFSKTLRDIISNSNIWAKVEQKVMFAFTSKYSLTLYEVVQKRRNLKYKTHDRFTIEEFRKILGVPEGKLKLFGDLNKYALKPAIKEVNALTDMDVKIIPIKRVRSVIELELWWSPKTIEGAQEAYAELERHSSGRKARMDGTVATMAVDQMITEE